MPLRQRFSAFGLLVALLVAILGLPAAALAAPTVEDHAAAATSGVRVVFVGGLGSTDTSNALTFGPLSSALQKQGPFTSTDFTTFDYADHDSCQPLASSAARLADVLRQMRDQHQASGVVLVGHSMGGVVALDALAAADDLTQADHPFVQRVITVDSPLGGITRLQRTLLVNLWTGACPAANDALQRYVDKSWPDTLSGRVSTLQQRGVKVFAVSNPEDLLLDAWTQQVPNSSANVTLSALDDTVNHVAALTAPTAVTQLAHIVTDRSA
jgi:pimeloyl-ACP methyl ester carboxylesterase